ncbi:MAG: motif [Planctomycetota bacterium]
MDAPVHPMSTMRKIVLTLSLGFALAACADHTGKIAVAAEGPNPPINTPDPGVINGGGTGGSTNEPGSSGSTGNAGSGGSGSGGSSSGGGCSSSGGGSGGSSGGTGSGGSSGGTGSGGGTTPGGGSGAGGGGGSGGSPVPEPGTLLLVGTGLTGAALLRRRRQLKVVEGK